MRNNNALTYFGDLVIGIIAKLLKLYLKFIEYVGKLRDYKKLRHGFY